MGPHIVLSPGFHGAKRGAEPGKCELRAKGSTGGTQRSTALCPPPLGNLYLRETPAGPSHPTLPLSSMPDEASPAPSMPTAASPGHSPPAALCSSQEAPRKAGALLLAWGQSLPRECSREQRSPDTAASSPGGWRSRVSPCHSGNHHHGQNAEAQGHPTASPSPGTFPLLPTAFLGRRLPWH